MDKEFDFKTPIEKTSVSMAKIILTNFLENFDTFVYEDLNLTEEQKASYAEKGADFGIHVMGIMSATDLPADYIGYPIDKVIAGFGAIKMYLEGTIRQMHDEMLSRSLGAKSPVTGTYARDCATVGEVMMALKGIREETGNNPDDYFIKKNPELSPEVVADEKK